MIAEALQLAAAFNLVCAGTVREGPVGLALPEANGAPISETFRVDLGARLWCRGDCTRVEPLALLGEGYAVLRETHDAGGGNVITVWLPDGAFTDTTIVDTNATLRSGQCRRAPFSGFPGLTA